MKTDDFGGVYTRQFCSIFENRRTIFLRLKIAVSEIHFRGQDRRFVNHGGLKVAFRRFGMADISAVKDCE